MDGQCHDFQRIRKAIEFIDLNYRSQPSLDEVAAHVGLSPFHFHRMFTRWAGVSPKQFLQFVSIGHAKQMLETPGATLAEVADAVGLSGTGRLHDLFVGIEAMTPGEYGRGGESLSINYSFAESLFGRVLMASTGRGICYLAFADDDVRAVSELKKNFPNARYTQRTDDFQRDAIGVLNGGADTLKKIKLHVKGTDFQIKVWETLLRIPMGHAATYGAVAREIDNPGAGRAVGSAVGSNPVSFFIPCHRVIRSTGVFGQYMWGPSRKKVMLGWESARTSPEEELYGEDREED